MHPALESSEKTKTTIKEHSNALTIRIDSTSLSPVEGREYETFVDMSTSYEQMKIDIDLIDWDLIRESGGLMNFATIMKKDDLFENNRLEEGEVLGIEDA